MDRKYEFYQQNSSSVVAALPSTLVDGELVLDAKSPGEASARHFSSLTRYARKGSFVGDLSLSDRLRVVRGRLYRRLVPVASLTRRRLRVYRRHQAHVREAGREACPRAGAAFAAARERRTHFHARGRAVQDWHVRIYSKMEAPPLNSVDFLLEVVYLKNASGKMEGRYCTLKCGSSGQLMHFGYIHIEAAKQEDLLKTHGRAPFIAECVFDMEWRLSPDRQRTVGMAACGATGRIAQVVVGSTFVTAPIRSCPTTSTLSKMYSRVFEQILSLMISWGYSRNDYFMYFYI